MSLPELPRPGFEDRLRTAALSGPTFVLGGPAGAGKTTLLLRLARTLEREGWACVYLDLMAAASSPDRFVLAALDALPAEHFGDRLREATEIRRLVASGRPQHAQAVHAFMRGKFAGWDATIASSLRLLYGGSVKPANAADLFGRPDVDGGLIGGASLVAADFRAICAAAGT